MSDSARRSRARSAGESRFPKFLKVRSCRLAQPLLLFLDQQLRVTNDVEEENVPDLEARAALRFWRHNGCL